MAINTQAEEFIRIYNDLDRFLRKKYNINEYMNYSEVINTTAKKDRYINKNKELLKLFGNLRNAIVHNLTSEYKEAIAEPHPQVNTTFENIKNNIMNPPRAIDKLAVRTEKMYTVQSNRRVLEVMKHMNEHTYTHVPVVEENVVTGVFSENTVFTYIAKNEAAILEADTTIEEFREFLELDKHESEHFEFINKNASIIDVEELFSKHLIAGKRLSVVFITEKGEPTEKIQGMITPWDVAGYNG